MLQGGEGCQEFARVVGDLPVQTLDLTAPTSGEGNVTAVTSAIRPHCLPAPTSAAFTLSDLRGSQTRPGQTGPDQARPGQTREVARPG